MASSIVVTGVPDIDRKLRAMEQRLANKLVRQAIRKSAKDIALKDALAAVPVDTGKLRGTLAVRALKRSRSRLGAMVATKPGQYSDEQFPGAFLEFGTKERVQKTTGRETGRIRPKQFGYLRTSIYDNQERIRQTFIDDVRQLIAEAGR